MIWINPGHVWHIRDKELDHTSKALLSAIVEHQNMDSIFISNTLFAEMVGVTTRTIIDKFKVLERLGYIEARNHVRLETQTKYTVLNKEFLLKQILNTCNRANKKHLLKYYREQRPKIPEEIFTDSLPSNEEISDEFDKELHEMKERLDKRLMLY